MDAPHGPAPTSIPWIAAVASLVPLAAALASNAPVADPVPLPGAEAPALALPAPEEELPPSLPLAQAPAPKRILVIGDSHTAGTFGRALDLLLRSLPDTEVMTVGACGLSPDGFLESKATRCGYLQIEEDDFRFKRRLKTPHIDELLAEHQPDLTIVELGANQIHTAARDPDGAAADIKRLAHKVRAAGSRLLWVGPPYGDAIKKPPSKLENVYQVLAASLPASATFFDSRPSALPFLEWRELRSEARRRGDGKHFDSLGVHGQQAARKWAMEVFQTARVLLEAPVPGPERIILAEGPVPVPF